ncbi:unnamed protein product [Rhizophagus irregularis]|nr:unnamed protein product [Rhizophagus irregularis]CAB4413155.1 unnamed protein product [Rhizophagus irregularis]
MSQQSQYHPDVEIALFYSSKDEIENILKEITDIPIIVKQNIGICNALKKRVCDANLTTAINIKVQDQEFFNNQNYQCLQTLILATRRIKKFIEEISQMITLPQPKSIEKTYKAIYRDFENCLISLEIKLPDNYEVDLEELIKNHLRADPEKLIKRFEEFGDDVRDLQDGFSSMVLQLSELNEKTDRASNKTQLLKFSDFKETAKEPRKGGRVTKWVDVKNRCREFAFKDISENKNVIQNQVTILNELHDCQNIIKFYGITCDGNKWYSVMEWAEYGNLREFYTTRKNLFDIRLKLRMSLDIARGLSFLRSVEILHRDIRAENILVTLNDTAKLANFQLCRTLRAATFTSPEFKRNKNLERVRYCAPELLSERLPYLKYDYNCEVYSFGILLWEIAEEKTPYRYCVDIPRLTSLVSEKYRESFSENNMIPEKFKNLSINAVNHDPESRPNVTTMFEVLCDCFESFERPPHTHTPSNSASNSSQNNQNRTPPEPTRKNSLMQKIRMKISKK